MLSPFSDPSHYEVERDPGFPGDGDWRAPVFFFDRDHRVSTEVRDSRWGTPIAIRVNVDDDIWVGFFTAGGFGVDGVFATPDPDRICCVVQGYAYVVDVTDPAAGADVAHVATVSVAAAPAADRLFFRASSM